MKLGKLILKTTIKREPQTLYYCGTSKDGFITINSAIMNRGGRKKSKVAKKTVVKKKK
jgi:hypothetical protein